LAYRAKLRPELEDRYTHFELSHVANLAL